jgi:magnesium transporter
MTLTMQALKATKPDWKWFWMALRQELGAAVLLAAGCGGLVFAIVWSWRRDVPSAGVVGVTVAGSLIIACLAGVVMPALLHALKLDPKIAAGPVTLAVTDVLTLLLYFSLASWLL